MQQTISLSMKEKVSLSLSLSLRSVIDHLLSDDGRTDLGIKDEWLDIPFKHEKVTMVMKIIIGIMICRDCIASGQNSIMISSQMSDFRHLWHAHPQR